MKINREQWLKRATTVFRREWKKLGVVVPADVQVSCGFPGGGNVLRRIGECWPRRRSTAGVNQVFISPTQGASRMVLGILGYELLHAADDCKSGHGKVFNANSLKVGYSGGRLSLPSSAESVELVTKILNKLGEYPHAALNADKRKQKLKDGLQKYECEVCADVLYSTAKKVEMFGVPCCRECGVAMVSQKRQAKNTA